MNDASPYYHRDGITIHHGDCLEVLPTLPSESIDFVLTDPPYLVPARLAASFKRFMLCRRPVQ